MARPPHEPSNASRQLVSLHASIGTPQDVIARALGLTEKTLRKHYKDELDLALAQANATIGGALFNKAKKGDVTAQIFWLKTRAGFRETNNLNHSSEDGSMTPRKITRRIIRPAPKKD